jgi:hypothetical protein
MKKQFKRRILAHARRITTIEGKDLDGDIFKYRGKYYAVNILSGIVKEVKH